MELTWIRQWSSSLLLCRRVRDCYLFACPICCHPYTRKESGKKCGNSVALVEMPDLYFVPCALLPWMRGLPLMRASMVSVPCLHLSVLLCLPKSSKCSILFDCQTRALLHLAPCLGLLGRCCQAAIQKLTGGNQWILRSFWSIGVAPLCEMWEWKSVCYFWKERGLWKIVFDTVRSACSLLSFCPRLELYGADLLLYGPYVSRTCLKVTVYLKVYRCRPAHVAIH